MRRVYFILVSSILIGLGIEAQCRDIPVRDVPPHPVGAEGGDPEAITERFARDAIIGEEDWQPIESLAQDGYGEAVTKSLGHRLWQELRNGAVEPSPSLVVDMRRAARILDISEIQYILAVHAVTGQWRSALLFSPDRQALTKALDRRKPEQAALGCLLSATPTTIATGLAGYCVQAARQGNATAQYALANQHLARPDDFSPEIARHIASDLNIRKSESDALRLYRAAAKQGHAGAQARLSTMLATGSDAARNLPEARRLAESAAEQGDPEGRAIWGLMLLRGLGDDAAPDRAIPLLRQAARAGNRLAQFTLATLHMRGQGVRRDFTEALTWVHLSELSLRGDPPAKESDALLLEPIDRTRATARSIGNVAIDLDARIRAAQLRKELADSGEWPLVDPIPAAVPPQK